MSVKGTQEKAPKSVRTVEIIVGAITLVLAGLVIAFPLFAVLFIVFWLSLSLIFGGLEGIIIGASARHLSRGWRALSLGAGVFALIMGFVVLALPGAAVVTSIFLLGLGLLVLGSGAIAQGISGKHASGWARGMLIGIGAITVVLAMMALVFPVFGAELLYVFLATALIINGIGFIIAGVTGSKFTPITPGSFVGGKKRQWESDAA
jgi:uncharacterized membrane protein HdeD (DUF308 family)